MKTFLGCNPYFCIVRLDDLKYLVAYLGPLSAYISIYFGGLWSFTALLVAFALIPLLELILPDSHSNDSALHLARKEKLALFDWLLYANIPILYGLIILFCWRTSSTLLTSTELIGMVLALGIYIGASGINVGHELGHRSNKMEQFLSLLLLLPGLYMHFSIEHNHGHHRYVATREDPATAHVGESLYHFWWRSTIGCWFNAWAIEARLLKKKGRKVWSWRNRMVRYVIVQIGYLLTLGLVFGWFTASLVALAGVVGFLLLETINYIEHYGLLRRLQDNGRYERVDMKHSWNSNHIIGRIFLYELTRHADHHHTASKKYQQLLHHNSSPQLPTGYPGTMILALFPPLWFKIMNDRIPKEMLELA